VPVILGGVLLSVALGLFAYFALAWYVACVVAAGVSMLVTIGSRFFPHSQNR
jgi:hypothetical protein